MDFYEFLFEDWKLWLHEISCRSKTSRSREFKCFIRGTARPWQSFGVSESLKWYPVFLFNTVLGILMEGPWSKLSFRDYYYIINYIFSMYLKQTTFQMTNGGAGPARTQLHCECTVKQSGRSRAEPRWRRAEPIGTSSSEWCTRRAEGTPSLNKTGEFTFPCVC